MGRLQGRNNLAWSSGRWSTGSGRSTRLPGHSYTLWPLLSTPPIVKKEQNQTIQIRYVSHILHSGKKKSSSLLPIISLAFPSKLGNQSVLNSSFCLSLNFVFSNDQCHYKIKPCPWQRNRTGKFKSVMLHTLLMKTILF